MTWGHIFQKGHSSSNGTTANLDSKLSAEFLAILRRLAEAGRTVILTSHDPLVVESEVVDRVYSLRDGQLIEVVDTRRAWP